MGADLSTVFTGLRFRNPFMLASAPPTESDSNIMRAFEAGWGGVVTKTIGLHPVVNVKGPFDRGDSVNIVGPESKSIGCGVANYSAADLERIKGCRSTQITQILLKKSVESVD